MAASLPQPRPISAIRLDGGSPALDFVNTVHDRSTPGGEDYLGTPARLLEWSRLAGVLSAEEVEAASAASPAAALMTDAVALREALHALFLARLEGRPAPPDAVGLLDRWLHQAFRNRSLAADQDDGLAWRTRAVTPRLPLQRIALSAMSDLRDIPPSRLGRCPGCGWLFHDRTRSASRRWCAMQACGSISKMRRLRRRRSDDPSA